MRSAPTRFRRARFEQHAGPLGLRFCRRLLRFRVIAVLGPILLMSPGLGLVHAQEKPACSDLPPCRGCGCRGGPGWRGPNGRCVGYRALDRVCGVPPTTRCTYEGATGAGLNRDCVLGRDTRSGRSNPAEDDD